MWLEYNITDRPITATYVDYLHTIQFDNQSHHYIPTLKITFVTGSSKACGDKQAFSYVSSSVTRTCYALTDIYGDAVV